jgi:DNA-binding beta-propeller fold protein YncE
MSRRFLLLLFLLLLPLAPDAIAQVVPVRSYSATAEGKARFSPLGIATGLGGLLYAADGANDRVVVFDSTGALLSTVGFSGSGDGRFIRPIDVAAAEGPHLYVLDAGNERVQLFDRYEQFQEVLLSRADGTIGVPSGIEADPYGRLYVADEETDLVHVLRSFTGEEEFTFGGFGSEPGRFRGVADIAVDRMRAIYVADRGNNRVQVFDPLGGYLRTIQGTKGGLGPLRGPTGVAVDRFGRVFVADTGNGRVVVFSASGTAVAEIRSVPGGADLIAPRGVAIDEAGRLLVSDPETGRIEQLRIGFASHDQ